MPLTRSHFRNRSRSVTSNAVSCSITASRTPVFYPPSHYAAAAGLEYPLPSPRLPTNEPDASGMSVSKGAASFVQPQLTAPLPQDAQISAVSSPLSQNTTVQSTSHFNRMSRFITRSSSRSSSRSPHPGANANNGQDNKDGGERRESNLMDLPLVELQLIPTLKDTVDRMTHPPASPHNPEEADHGDYEPLVTKDITEQEYASLIPPRGSRLPASHVQHGSNAHTNDPPEKVQALVHEERREKPQMSRLPLQSQSHPRVPSPAMYTEENIQQPVTSLRRNKPLAARQKPPNAMLLDPTMFSLPVRSTGKSDTLSRAAERPESPRRAPEQRLVPQSMTRARSRSNPALPQAPSKSPRFITPQPSSITKFPSRIPARSNIPRPYVSSSTSTETAADGNRWEKATVSTAIERRAQNPRTVPDRRADERNAGRSPRVTGLSRQPQRAANAQSTKRSERVWDVEKQPRHYDIRRGGNRAPSRGRIGLGFRLDPSHPSTCQDGNNSDSDVVVERIEAYAEPGAENPEYFEDEDTETSLDAQVREQLLQRPRRESLVRQNTAERRQSLRDVLQDPRYHAKSDRSSSMHSKLAKQPNQTKCVYASPHAAATSLDQPVPRSSRYESQVPDAQTDEEVPEDDESTYSADERDEVWSSESGSELEVPSRQSWTQHRQSLRAPIIDTTPVVQSNPQRKSSPPGRYRSTASQRDVSCGPTGRSADQSQFRESLRRTRRSSVWITGGEESTSSNYEEDQDLTPRIPATGDATGYFPEPQRPAIDAYRIVDDSTERERVAFGIPRSLSFGADESPDESSTLDDNTDHNSRLLRSESDESLVAGYSRMARGLSFADDRWHAQNIQDGLSRAAHAVFEGLVDNRRHKWRHEDRPNNAREKESRVSNNSDAGPSLSLRPNSVLANPKPSNVPVSRENLPGPTMHEISPKSPSTHSTWRSTLRLSTYNDLLSRYGPSEIQRQERIYELLKSEQVYVKRLRATVKSFILPLRCQDTRNWVEGVPEHVSRLFDWFEDILNLHAGIARALRTALRTWEAGGIVEKVAESLLYVVPSLEVYQPYLVRVDEVREYLLSCVDDPHDAFGEYVCMRESLHECEGWSLERSLQEPGTRLNSYPEIFERLLNSTPKEHRDYLSTISLLCTTRTMIHVMDEVRIREEEYDFVKYVASQIVDLPTSVEIATRERRLLHHGILQYLTPKHGSHNEDLHLAKPTLQLNGEPLNSSGSEIVQKVATQRASRLASAIHKWHVRRGGRSGSVSSSGSSSQSMSSDESTRSNETPLTPLSDAHELISGDPDVAVLRVLVFTDLVMFLRVSGEYASNDQDIQERWTLLEDTGLCKIMRVTEHEHSPNEQVILDVILVDVNRFAASMSSKTGIVRDIALVLPSSSEQRQYWTAAFHQHQEYTIRNLSFPSRPSDNPTLDVDPDLEYDTDRSLKAILASGLPMPKSPSMQLEDVLLEKANDPAEHEREERGWWSLRFQQVLREVQRRKQAIWLF